MVVGGRGEGGGVCTPAEKQYSSWAAVMWQRESPQTDSDHSHSVSWVVALLFVC